VLPHIFEPFFTTKEPGKGSGLGLAQVYGFVKQSGGGVGIETRIGEGTSVTVFLPSAEVIPADRERVADVEQRLRNKETLNVLIVDDDKAVLRSTVRLLTALGHAAFPTISGGEALILIASGLELDLVLADFAMPEMTGLELARAIEATRPDLPVILVTSYNNREVLKDFGEARILQKPYTEDEMMGKFFRALN
jgi:CheY-like chemotaxis protein